MEVDGSREMGSAENDKDVWRTYICCICCERRVSESVQDQCFLVGFSQVYIAHDVSHGLLLLCHYPSGTFLLVEFSSSLLHLRRASSAFHSNFNLCYHFHSSVPCSVFDDAARIFS